MVVGLCRFSTNQHIGLLEMLKAVAGKYRLCPGAGCVADVWVDSDHDGFRARSAKSLTETINRYQGA